MKNLFLVFFVSFFCSFNIYAQQKDVKKELYNDIKKEFCNIVPKLVIPATFTEVDKELLNAVYDENVEKVRKILSANKFTYETLGAVASYALQVTIVLEKYNMYCGNFVDASSYSAIAGLIIEAACHQHVRECKTMLGDVSALEMARLMVVARDSIKDSTETKIFYDLFKATK